MSDSSDHNEIAPTIVLASTSPYRRKLLSQLFSDFICAAPGVEELAQPNEHAGNLVARLARAKAEALTNKFPNSLIIGSDQVATLDGEIMTKPGHFDDACKQLSTCSGRSVDFFTGLCLTDSATPRSETVVEHYQVTFRSLSEREIHDYLLHERPYDCAGSFKVEGLGIGLFESMAGRDPNTLIGLPLIALTDLLRSAGVNPLLSAAERDKH